MKSTPLTTFITAGNIASDFTSNSIDVRALDRVGVLLTWTTAAVNAVIYLQVSLDDITYGNLTQGGTPITTAIAAANGSQLYDLDLDAFSYFRVFVDNTSGTPGTIDGKWRASWDGLAA